MITNRRLPFTSTIPAGMLTPLVGRDPQGQGGLEGVTNGGTRAVLTVVSSIDAPTTLALFVRATRNAELVPLAPTLPLVVPANGTFVLELGPENCAAHEIVVGATNEQGGELDVAWQVRR